MPTISDYLQAVSGSYIAPQAGKWVRLVNNSTSTAYLSTGATDITGLFTVQNVPGGLYTVYQGATNTGPWVATGDAAYSVDATGLGWFNVLDYSGVDPTGVADSTTGLQAAINAVPAAGGTVFFPGGTYKITASLTIPASDIWLVSTASAQISCSVATPMITVTGTAGTTIRRVVIDGLYLNGHSTATAGIQLVAWCIESRFRNNRIETMNGPGIDLVLDSFTNWITNNAIRLNVHGIRIGDQCNALSIYGNRLQNNSTCGITSTTTGSRYTTSIAGNDIEGNGDRGIYHASSSWYGLALTGNHFESNGQNTAAPNAPPSVEVAASATLDGCLVSGNSFVGASNQLRGFKFSAGTNGVIAGNVMGGFTAADNGQIDAACSAWSVMQSNVVCAAADSMMHPAPGQFGVGVGTPAYGFHVLGSTAGVNAGLSSLGLTNATSGGQTIQLSAGVPGLSEGGFGIKNVTSTNRIAYSDSSDRVVFPQAVLTAASVTGSAGLNLPHGAAPTSPNNGDIWSTSAGLFIRINGVTKTVTLT